MSNLKSNNEYDISVVVPCYNESQGLTNFVSNVAETLSSISWEIVAIDDGSSDNTLQTLHELSRDYPIRIIELSKNYGKEAALLAGLSHAAGQCVVTIDGDGQHPVKTIPKLYEKWKEGYEVVSAKKQTRGSESKTRGSLSNLFYKILHTLSGINLKNESDFKLLDRKVVESLLKFPERRRFYRGLVGLAGFRSCSVEFEVLERADQTESRWSPYQLLTYGIRNLVSYSAMPLYAIGALGILVILLACVLGVQTLFKYILGSSVEGFTTVILLVLFFGGFTFIQLGIMGLYIAELFHETKQRPAFVVREHTQPINRVKNGGGEGI